MISKMYTINQLVKKFNVPYRTVYYWIKTKKLPASQNVNKFKVNEWYISEEDWLEVPSFIRARYKK